MSKNIILKRKITIKQWKVQGSIATLKKDNIILLVLLYLDDNPNSLAKDISEHLFADIESRALAAQRLLSHAEILNLVKKTGNDRYGKNSYSLTDEGYIALERKESFIPEDGVWIFSTTEEKLLLSEYILNIKIVNPKELDANKETKRSYKGNYNLTDNITDTPKYLLEYRDTEVRPLFDNKIYRIDHLEKKAEDLGIDYSRNIKLEWDVSKKMVKLNSANNERYREEKNILTEDEVFAILLKNIGKSDDWNNQDETLAINFAELDERAKQTMRHDIYIKTPKVIKQESWGLLNFGNFEPITLKNIQVVPKNKEDAHEWYLWRLIQSINTFAVLKDFNKWNEEARLPFKGFDIPLVERNTFADSIWTMMQKEKNKEKAWHLIAAKDWEL